MAGFVKFIGWLVFVAGLAAFGVPFVMTGWPGWLAMETSIVLGVFSIAMGALLVGVAHLIGLAGKIAENASWFSAGAPAADKKSEEAASEPEPAAAKPAEDADGAQASASEESETANPDEPETTPPSEKQPSGAPESALYDAARHPPAVEEWTHRGRRVMTLEDGTFATEINGAWRRFVRLEDIDAAGR